MSAFHVIIPARLASSRLPQKPLVDLNGQPMIVRVAQIAQQSCAKSVTVATDSEKIVSVCAAQGIAAVLTAATHQNGTERVNEAAAILGLDHSETIINLQGDEPLMDSKALNLLANTLEHSRAQMATLACPFHNVEDFCNPNQVKVVFNQHHEALYFSRSTIPFWRDNAQNLPKQAFKHIGIYAYSVHFLKTFTQLPAHDLEKIEKLEQLRALAHGFKIAVGLWQGDSFIGVDTPEDVEKVRARLKAQSPK